MKRSIIYVNWSVNHLIPIYKETIHWGPLCHQPNHDWFFLDDEVSNILPTSCNCNASASSSLYLILGDSAGRSAASAHASPDSRGCWLTLSLSQALPLTSSSYSTVKWLVCNIGNGPAGVLLWLWRRLRLLPLVLLLLDLSFVIGRNIKEEFVVVKPSALRALFRDDRPLPLDGERDAVGVTATGGGWGIW